MGTTYGFRGDSFKSKFELNFAKQLFERNIKYEYEPHSLQFYSKVRMGICKECDSKDVWKIRFYTPDFWLPDYNFYIETKGKFPPETRKKMVEVKLSNKDKDIRLVFLQDNKLDKRSKSRYSDWAIKFGFRHFIMGRNLGNNIFEEWLNAE